MIARQAKGVPVPKITPAPGIVLEGRVVKLYDRGTMLHFGGGVLGYLPVSEISLTRVKRPSDVLRKGDTIRVRVTSVVFNPDNTQKVHVSAKALLDPWDSLPSGLSPKDRIVGTVVLADPRHVFVRLAGTTLDMLCPGTKRPYPVGARVMAEVVRVDPSARKLRGRILGNAQQGGQA